MPKKKPAVTIDGNTISGTAESINELLNKATEAINKPYLITSASIKEELCNYSYEINTGLCAGDKVTRKGSAIVHHDMLEAFTQLDCHLANLDDAFTSLAIKPNSLDEMMGHDLTHNFTVTGFKVQGTDENEGFVLIGDKWVSHGTIGLETPKISKSSAYAYFDELKEAIEKCRYEVEQYMNGKAVPKTEQGELPFPDKAEDTDFDNPM